jgi:malate synthase
VFNFAQDALSIPRGTIRATVLIETILAAFEMDEILFELRDHSAGLNAGRWDYIFSIIKKFRHRWDGVLPDRSQVTMTVPFMRAYTELLVRTCHRRGAHAMGGMAAFIPSRKNQKVNEAALAKVRDDKVRESSDGFDGTWVAHPDLVPVAKRVFDEVLGGRPHQKLRLRNEVCVEAADLLDFRVPKSTITLEGVRSNVDVALQYIESWLRGNGAAAINHLMEDTATAEISRAQLWQWIRHSSPIAEGGEVTTALYREMLERESQALARQVFLEPTRFQAAAELLTELVLSKSFVDFLTIPGYRYLDDVRAEQGAIG